MRWDFCRDLSRLSRDLSKPFESENDEKYQRIEKSWRENKNIHAFLDRDRDKLSRNAKIFRSRQISRSRSRLFGLDIDVETKSRNLDRDFSTVKTHFLTLSRLTLWRRRDRESRSRPRRDKSRPPGLDHGHCYHSDNIISLGSFSKSCFLKLASFIGKGSTDNGLAHYIHFRNIVELTQCDRFGPASDW